MKRTKFTTRRPVTWQVLLGVPLLCAALSACGGGAGAVAGSVAHGAGGAADDMARAAVRAETSNAARAATARAARAGQRVESQATAARSAGAAVKATNGRARVIARKYASDPAVQAATVYLVWDVGCEIATDSLPEDIGVVGERLLRRFAEFGLALVPREGVQSIAFDVLDSFGLDKKNESYEACVAILPQ